MPEPDGGDGVVDAPGADVDVVVEVAVSPHGLSPWSVMYGLHSLVLVRRYVQSPAAFEQPLRELHSASVHSVAV